jgi:menaquinone-dependent protoporphyrinogen oxidase
MARILVLYGTTERHTEKIAKAIGSSLKTDGFEISIVEAGTGDPAPSGYDAVIVAASLHAGKYQQAVAAWVCSHLAGLSQKPTAFVSVCLATASKRPGAAAEVEAINTRFLAQLGWHPTVTKPVAGALLYTQYNFFIRWFMKRIAAKEGGDTDTSRDYEYTDWADLRRFAQEFGRRIRAAA